MLVPYLHEREGLQIVGAVDIAPEMIGRGLGDLCDLRGGPAVEVAGGLEEAMREGADAAVVTTVSELEAAMPLLRQLVETGVNVVSTCEELSYPWRTQPDLSADLDRHAKAHEVSVLGTGVNPGFLMDFLPAAATAVCRNVEAIRIERIQDATYRRIPFQQKIGAGLTTEEFQRRVATRKLRHVGLTESMHMVAAKLGWTLDRTEDVVLPVLAEEEVEAGVGKVLPGMATGVNQVGRGFSGGEEILTLVFRATVGEKDPRDEIQIKGTPDLRLIIPGGTNGDIATCSIVANAVTSIVEAPAGLRTMVDIPPVTCCR